MSVKKLILFECNTDTEVFKDMDKFELEEAKKFALSIKLQFPKFSKGFNPSDFSSFIEKFVGEKNLVSLGRLSYPNEWQMQLKCNKIREELIRAGCYKINSRTCWISPLSQREVRGYVHWIPNAITEETIRGILEPHGEVIFIEVQKLEVQWNKKDKKVDCDSRYFALNLKPGRTMDDVPHFVKISGHHGLITIKGRAPSCFHCRTIGHRKSECQRYREKLSWYSNREPGSGVKRTKPRGKRYRPLPDAENPGAAVYKKKRKKAKVNNKAMLEVIDKLANLDLQGLSNLSSALSSVSSLLNQHQQVKEEMQVTNTDTASKGEEKTPQESGDQAAEGKKKKRKKKKKKTPSEESNESVPPNN